MHWRRWQTARRLRSAQAVLEQLWPAERLSLLLAVAGEVPDHVDTSDRERIGALWGVHALQLWVGQWLGALDSDRLDCGESAGRARKLARDLEEAAEVLREVSAGAPVDESALPRGRAPKVAELVAARRRGDIQAGRERFERRLASENAQRLAAQPVQWMVTVRPDRRYEAQCEEGLRVWAWSALPEALESELATWNPRPGPVKVTFRPERPTRLPEQVDATARECAVIPSCHTLEFDEYDAVYAAGGHADELAQTLAALRTTLTAETVQRFVDERLELLNAHSPQLPHLELDVARHEPTHTYSSAVTWVNPATIVRTPDHKAWGTINRPGPRSGAVWIPDAIRAWLDTADVPAKLRQSMLGGPVQLHRIPGPAGPLHTLTVDGTHRTHLWRVLDLPEILAYVENIHLPTMLRPWDFCDDSAPDHTETIAAIWRGLIDKGIVHGTFDTPNSPYATLELHTVPAIWLLHSPPLAAAYGRRYAELYPGAWTEVGIPEDAFTSAETWLSWATDAVRSR